MRILLFFSFLVLFISSSFSQDSKYWVFFNDKEGMDFDPYAYFDIKAIERRESLGLSLYDSTDFPVNPEYIAKVSNLVNETSYHSRWFNCLAVNASQAQIEEVRKLSCVSSSMKFMERTMELAAYMDYETGTRTDSLIKYQTARMGRTDFHKAGIDGAGIRIAVLDAGFTAADESPCFEHLRKEDKIKGTYDFVKKKTNVYHGNSHGTAVLSCITGVCSGEDPLKADTLGLATGAEFLLARTERGLLEIYSEEENWLAAVEWCDKNGADIINSSLGYTGNRYLYDDMNGQNTLVSRAGNLAAKKGILVVNSAGNDGASDWNFIGAPADADSVLAVGALLPWSGVQTSFSSVGPTYDYRMKPNVTAYGHVIAAKGDHISETQGTSFSSPITAGFAACAWQANRGWTNMELFKALEEGSDLFPYFDYAHGYGVPQAIRFLGEVTTTEATFIAKEESGLINVNIMKPSLTVRDEEYQLKILLNESTTCYSNYEDYLFYQFQTPSGVIISYKVIDLQGASSFLFLYPGVASKVLIHYEGFTQELKLP